MDKVVNLSDFKEGLKEVKKYMSSNIEDKGEEYIGDLNKLKTKNRNNTVEAINEICQYVKNGTEAIETVILKKGGELKENSNLFDMALSINNLGNEDVEGKKELIDMLIMKNPSLENKISINSTLSELTFYVSLIGEIPIKVNECLSYKNLISLLNFDESINIRQIKDYRPSFGNDNLTIESFKNKIMSDENINITLG